MEEFDRLWSEVAAQAQGYARRLIVHREDAEDLLSEAYVIARHRFAAYDPAFSFKNWVFLLILKYAAVSWQRKNRLRITSFTDELAPEGEEWEPMDPAAFPDEGLLWHEIEQSLPTSLYRMFVTHFLAGSIPETAQRLGLPLWFVERKLRTAHRRLAHLCLN